MKKVLLILVLGTAVFATSCKKDVEATPQKDNVIKVQDNGKAKNLDSVGNYD